MSETTFAPLSAPLSAPLRMTELEAYAKLLKAGIDAPNPALVARLVAAAATMQAGIAR